jgi:hypothetical protein
VTDIRTVVESLSRDLADWRNGSSKPPLDKHASQIEGVVTQLTTALTALDSTLADTSRATQSVLDYHHIWDFFRNKLALRFVPWYQPFLAAADDLAWAAWRPMRDAVHAATGRELREPPLVFFSRSAAPFAVTRGENYRELLPRGGLSTTPPEEVAAALVVPVISLPWHRINWLPVTLSAAHEVGHIVVADLGLLPWLTDRLAAARLPGDHLQAWTAWREEVFADVFAAVVCGSATAVALQGQLGDEDPAQVPQPPWDDYPPVPLRADLIQEAAGRRAVPPLERKDSLAGSFAADVPAVVSALLDHDIPGAGRLGDLFPTVDHAKMRDDADRLGRSHDIQTSEIRALLAAATHAFRTGADPPAMQQAALIRAAHIRDVSRRSVRPTAARRDHEAGLRLADLLTPG